MVDLAYIAEKRRQSAAPSFLASQFAQRAFDLLLAALIIILAAPIMLLVAIAIYVEDGGDVFYVQPRVGRHGKVFGCMKFRSMVPDAEARIEAVLAANPQARLQWATNRKLTRDPRVTRVGRLIRRGSIDELPQLINVFRGEMALVGPRPIMLDERKLYGRRIAIYTQVRPGITGLWQVSGRSDASFRSRIAMDAIYVRNRSVILQLAILTRTVPAVLGAKGSY